jgi:uncharacterized protein YbcV (DUF1398 family)
MLFKMTRSNMANLVKEYALRENLIDAVAEATDAKAPLSLEGLLFHTSLAEWLTRLTGYVIDSRSLNLLWRRYEESKRVAARVRAASQGVKWYHKALWHACVYYLQWKVPQDIRPMVHGYETFLRKNALSLSRFLQTLPHTTPIILQVLSFGVKCMKNRSQHTRFAKTMQAPCMRGNTSIRLANEMRNVLQERGYDGWYVAKDAATTKNGTIIDEHVVLWTDRADDPFLHR